MKGDPIMPIYEYRCSDCGHEFEVTQKITADPLTECISCGGKVKKLISTSSFHLKGTGWYVTDYANKSGNNGSKCPPEDKKEDASSSIDSSAEKAPDSSSATKESTSTKETASPAS